MSNYFLTDFKQSGFYSSSGDSKNLGIPGITSEGSTATVAPTMGLLPIPKINAGASVSLLVRAPRKVASRALREAKQGVSIKHQTT